MNLVERVVALHLRRLAETQPTALTLPREIHLPPHLRDHPGETPEGTDLSIYTWERPVGPSQKPGFFLIIFAGKAAKPLIGPFYYPNAEQRQKRIDETIASRKSLIEYKQKKLQERRDFVHGIQVGEIFYTSWGYDQTNIDFYEVVEIKGKMVVVREIASKVEKSEQQADYVVAVPHHFTGPPKLVKPGPGGGFKINDHSASKWDGRPKYQTAFGYGH